MPKVSLIIEARVRETFSPEDAESALAALSEMRVPPPEGEWTTTRVRVQAAILISAQAKLEKLLNGVAGSQIDWRDSLMSGGLGDENWRSVAKEAGFDIA